MSYPYGTDCGWLACDEHGQLAVFITAGEGPLPKTVLTGHIEIEDQEDVLLTLPVIGDAQLLAEVSDPSSFAELGKRGLYVYDWSDVHRVEGRTWSYELVATPSVGLVREHLPQDIQAVALALRGSLGGKSFKPEEAVGAAGVIDWVWPAG